MQSQKKKAQLQSRKKGQDGNNMATTLILSIKEGCSTPVADREAKNAPSLFLSVSHKCKIVKNLYLLYLTPNLLDILADMVSFGQFEIILTGAFTSRQ